MMFLNPPRSLDVFDGDVAAFRDGIGSFWLRIWSIEGLAKRQEWAFPYDASKGRGYANSIQL